MRLPEILCPKTISWDLSSGIARNWRPPVGFSFLARDELVASVFARFLPARGDSTSVLVRAVAFASWTPDSLKLGVGGGFQAAFGSSTRSKPKVLARLRRELRIWSLYLSS